MTGGRHAKKREFSKVIISTVGAAATGFYYSKAKAENRIKLRKKYGPEIYNDTKEV